MADPRVITAQTQSLELVNKVLRQTYILLSMTLLFSAAMAMFAMAINAPYLGLFMLVPFFGLMWAVHKTANSSWGLVWTFALTGFLGFNLGPILNYYVAMTNGSEIIAQAFGLTAAAFLGLSVYTVVTKKDFSFLSSFLVVGFFVLIGSVVISFFVQSTILQQMIAGFAILFGSALILYQTSSVVRGGETNYILATVGLFVGLYNIFTSLLFFLGMGGDD